MKKFLIVAGMSLLLTSCAKPPAQIQTLKASRADGIVTIGYMINRTTHFVVIGDSLDFSTAEGTATRICQGWGFKGAQTIDLQPRLICDHKIFDQCDTGVMYQQYQCTEGSAK